MPLQVQKYNYFSDIRAYPTICRLNPQINASFFAILLRLSVNRVYADLKN